jgi:hypothetical protein
MRFFVEKTHIPVGQTQFLVGRAHISVEKTHFSIGQIRFSVNRTHISVWETHLSPYEATDLVGLS